MVGTTKELAIYSSERLPFTIIDTVGFEPSLLKEIKAINAVKKWSKDSAKNGKVDNKINVIWFCVEGTSSKLFPKTIKDLSRATSMWESVPVINCCYYKVLFSTRKKTKCRNGKQCACEAKTLLKEFT